MKTFAKNFAVRPFRLKKSEQWQSDTQILGFSIKILDFLNLILHFTAH